MGRQVRRLAVVGVATIAVMDMGRIASYLIRLRNPAALLSGQVVSIGCRYNSCGSCVKLRRFAVNKIVLPLMLCLCCVPVAQAVDYQKLGESVDTGKAAESVDQDKMGEAVGTEGVDYQKAYEAVDKEKAADSVDLDKAREALTD